MGVNPDNPCPTCGSCYSEYIGENIHKCRHCDNYFDTGTQLWKEKGQPEIYRAKVDEVDDGYRILVYKDGESLYVGSSTNETFFRFLEFDTEEEAIQYIDDSEKLYRETELKPCPFCGSKATLKKGEMFGSDSLDENYSIECDNPTCNMGASDCLYDANETNRARIIKEWNTRPKIDNLNQALIDMSELVQTVSQQNVDLEEQRDSVIEFINEYITIEMYPELEEIIESIEETK